MLRRSRRINLREAEKRAELPPRAGTYKAEGGFTFTAGTDTAPPKPTDSRSRQRIGDARQAEAAPPAADALPGAPAADAAPAAAPPADAPPAGAPRPARLRPSRPRPTRPGRRVSHRRALGRRTPGCRVSHRRALGRRAPAGASPTVAPSAGAPAPGASPDRRALGRRTSGWRADRRALAHRPACGLSARSVPPHPPRRWGSARPRRPRPPRRSGAPEPARPAPAGGAPGVRRPVCPAGPSANGVATAPTPADDIAPPEGRLERLRGRLARSRSGFGQGLLGLLGAGELDEESWEDVEATLLQADLGPEMTIELVEMLRTELARRGVRTPEQARAAAARRAHRGAAHRSWTARCARCRTTAGPAVLLVVGVNGTGKTTTTGKLARVLVVRAGGTWCSAPPTPSGPPPPSSSPPGASGPARPSCAAPRAPTRPASRSTPSSRAPRRAPTSCCWTPRAGCTPRPA